MKKMLKNKKGFTLIELLAVIVVLAIIMVIATQQVTKAIDTARSSSFDSSYKMIVKEIKNKIAEKQLGHSVVIECDDTAADDDDSNDCSKVYDISKDDYTMKVTEEKNDKGKITGYKITLDGKGKFANQEQKSATIPY